VQALGKPLLANAHQILARKGRKPAHLWVRAGEHDANELGLLLGVKLRRAPVTWPVGEPIDAIRVVADDPIAQRLTVHARRLRRLVSAHAIERVGNGQDAPRHARIALGLRQLAQHHRRAIAPDR
jgi:hypothetical protein